MARNQFLAADSGHRQYIRKKIDFHNSSIPIWCVDLKLAWLVSLMGMLRERSKAAESVQVKIDKPDKHPKMTDMELPGIN